MGARRVCYACRERPILSGRDLCERCAETFDDALAGLLEAAAGDTPPG